MSRAIVLRRYVGILPREQIMARRMHLKTRWILPLFLSSCSPHNDGRAIANSTEIDAWLRGEDESLTRDADLSPDEDVLQPTGAGKLTICRPSDRGLSAFVLPENAYFVEGDGASEDVRGRAGTLRLRTTERATFPEGRECAIVAARIETDEVPANYADAKPITGFLMAEGHSFSLYAPDDGLGSIAGPVKLRARATTDFK